MANFHYFHPADNVAPNATWSITLGSVDTEYPLTNLYNFEYANLANPTKLIGNTGTFLANFGSAQRIDAVMIWHNFDAALAYTIKMNATNSWGSPTVSFSGAAPTKRADDYTKKIYKDLTGVSGYSTGGFQYLQIDVTGTNSVPLGLKVMVFSRIRQTSRNFNYGVRWTENHISIDMATDAMFPWAYDLGSAPRQIRANMHATDADVEAIREWFRACGGRSKITGFVPDPTSADFYLVRWGNSLAPNLGTLNIGKLDIDQPYPDLSKLELSFDEITAGDPEWY